MDFMVWKSVPPMDRSYVVQNSSNLSLLLFMMPHPSIPMALSRPSISPSHGVVCSLARLVTVVKGILALLLTVVGQCIAMDEGDVDVLPLHFDLHPPDVVRLPFH